MNPVRPLAAIAAALLIAPATHADVIIDTFEVGDFIEFNGGDDVDQFGLDTNEVIKGIRTVKVVQHPGGPTDGVLELTTGVGDDAVEIFSASGGSMIYTFAWSGFATIPSANNLNTDFSNESAIVLEFPRVDFAIGLTIRVNSSVPGEANNALINDLIDQPGTYVFPYDDFINTSGGGPDDPFGWSNVRNVRLEFNVTSPDAVGVIEFSDIRASGIPEPATASLLAAGLAALITRRRRA